MDFLTYMTKLINAVITFFQRTINDYVVAPFSKITGLDVADMVLMTLLLYTIYRFTRKRRAGRLLLGLYLIIALSILVTLFELPALTFVVRLFAASALFCIVVIFQPEFRDILERIGNGRLLNPGSDTLPRRKIPAAREVTEQLTDAVMKMADSKTGALIVMEGLTKLGDYIATGKLVDARVTSHLLRNIFFDKSPLHDGAVIIRDMRIYAAECVLPAAKGRIDFGGMGTRHRAAVGVTEVSDALVIVVSEQTGIVSVAQNGSLLRGVSREMLEDILMTYMAGHAYHNYKRRHLQKSYREILERVATIQDDNKKTKTAPKDGTPVVEILPQDASKEEKGEPNS